MTMPVPRWVYERLAAERDALAAGIPQVEEEAAEVNHRLQSMRDHAADLDTLITRTAPVDPPTT